MSSKEKKALPPELNLATIGTSGTFGVHSLRPPPKCLIVLVELNKPVTEASSPQNRVGMPHFSDCCVATVCLTPVAFSPWGTE